MRYISCFFIATLASAQPLSAQTTNDVVLQRASALWKQVNIENPQPSSDIIFTEINKIAKAMHDRTGECLPKSTVVESVLPATGALYVTTGILAEKYKNAWTVTANHTDCGFDIARYQIVKNSDGSFFGFRINKGRSLANETLISDALATAAVQVWSKLNNSGVKCEFEQPSQIGVFRILEEEKGLGPDFYGVRLKGGWSEIWPITMCGKTVEATIHFIADGVGGAYINIQGDEIKILQAVETKK